MDIYQDGGSPIMVWAADLEAGAMEQAVNLSRLPFVIDHVSLMPDAHQGYGMPVGGVLFADNAVVPYAIGVDIGCGVTLIETDLAGDLAPENIDLFLRQVARDVPVGNGPQAEHRQPEGEDYLPDNVSDRIAPFFEYARKQLGTLGGGNHFLELQRDEDERIWFMLHSGSRSLGKKTCDLHHKIALKLCQRDGLELPHNELAYLPWGTQEAADYWDDMSVALLWAEESRRRMAGKAISAFGKVWGVKAWQVLDIHHNYAAWENHYGVDGIVHRKGAVRAGSGEIVLIPGSMSTGSFIAQGLGNPSSFSTCQHGAGRARSRAATRKMLTMEEMDADLAAKGVQLITPKREAVIDEASIAYKDIDAVMALSADLVTPLSRLTPLGVVKG